MMHIFEDELEKISAKKKKIDKGAVLAQGTLLAPIPAVVGTPLMQRLTKKMEKNDYSIHHTLKDASPELAKQFKAEGGRFIRDAKMLSPDSPVKDLPHFGVFPEPLTEAQIKKFGKKFVYVPKGSSRAAIAHELGHGTGKMPGKLMNKLINFDNKTLKLRRFTTLGLGPASQGLIHMKGIKDDKTKEKISKYGRNIALLSAAPTVPLLGEEARATMRAIKYAPKGNRLRYAAELVPAFGTYFMHGPAPFLTAASGLELARRYYKSKSKKNKAK